MLMVGTVSIVDLHLSKVRCFSSFFKYTALSFTVGVCVILLLYFFSLCHSSGCSKADARLSF